MPTKVVRFKGKQFKLPADNILLSSVRFGEQPIKWRQVGQMLVLKDDCPGALTLVYDRMQPMPVAAYFPFPAEQR